MVLNILVIETFTISCGGFFSTLMKAVNIQQDPNINSDLTGKHEQKDDENHYFSWN